MYTDLLRYDLGEGAEAFSTRRDAVLPYPVIQGHQVHGCRVAVVDRAGMTREELEGYDAFVTHLPDVAIGVRTADCIPVLLYEAEARVVAAIHAGWRGTALHISRKAIEQMAHKYGCKPARLRAVIGPGIGPESFQVGEEVVERFREADFPIDRIVSFRGRPYIDLFQANRWLLEEAGVPAARIHVTGIDTYTDASFFSARREGVQCGRIINAIKLL